MGVKVEAVEEGIVSGYGRLVAGKSRDDGVNGLRKLGKTRCGSLRGNLLLRNASIGKRIKANRSFIPGEEFVLLKCI